jgi:hypothetical protein
MEDVTDTSISSSELTPWSRRGLFVGARDAGQVRLLVEFGSGNRPSDLQAEWYHATRRAQNVQALKCSLKLEARCGSNTPLM